MLRVIGKTEAVSPGLTVDYHIPFSFEFSGFEAVVPYYAMMRSGDTSLQEIGLDPHKGGICRVVVTYFDAFLDTIAPWVPLCETREPGVPVCDLTAWKGVDPNEYWDRFIDHEASTEVIVGRDYARISYGSFEAGPVSRCFTTPQLDFGVDSDGLLRQLDFHHLDDEQVRTLREHLDGKRKGRFPLTSG